MLDLNGMAETAVKVIMSAILSTAAAANAEPVKTKLNEYLNYSLPIEPRNITTMPDVDVSQALGTPLVRMGAEGQVVSGVANKWEVDPKGNFIDFHLDSRAKWSDGSRITPGDIIASFRDAKAHFQKTLPSVFESFSSMTEISPDILRVSLVKGVTPAAFLPKLIDNSMGILKIVNWAPSLKVTSGPYSVKSVDEKELVLEINPHYLFLTPDMISEIHLRRTESFVTATTLLEDQWPDMVNLTTGITKSELAKLPRDYSFFHLPEHRLLNMRYVGHGDLEGARAVFAYLRANADFSKIADLFEGGKATQQVYPASLPLRGKSPAKPQITRGQLLAAWKKPEIKIAYSLARMQPEIKLAFEKLVTEALPFKVRFFGLNAKEIGNVHLMRKYDLQFGSVGVGDENLDGALSFYIEQSPAYFPSDKTEKGNFLARLKAIRLTQGDQTEAFRQLVYDVVDLNYFLPIAHFSTTFVARKGIDFSRVPRFGEVVPFSSIARKK